MTWATAGNRKLPRSTTSAFDQDRTNALDAFASGDPLMTVDVDANADTTPIVLDVADLASSSPDSNFYNTGGLFLNDDGADGAFEIQIVPVTSEPLGSYIVLNDTGFAATITVSGQARTAPVCPAKAGTVKGFIRIEIRDDEVIG